MKNFIDFIVDQSKDPALGKAASDALANSDAKALSAWFAQKGYSVSEAESQQLIDNKSTLSQENIQQSVKAGY